MTNVIIREEKDDKNNFKQATISLPMVEDYVNPGYAIIFRTVKMAISSGIHRTQLKNINKKWVYMNGGSKENHDKLQIAILNYLNK